jgi:putative peptidoglycan lipid II flippase
MNLFKAATTIGALTLVSRVFGFARDMLMARILGAGFAADCFIAAFKLPNLFRRLFAEGAFSAAFVPMYNQHMKDGAVDGRSAAHRFAEDVLAVFVPVLLLFTALMQMVMPGIVWLLAGGFTAVPGKFEFAVELTRITFPYLMLISLASLLGGILNSLSRFAVAAATPILLNLCLVAALVFFRDNEQHTAQALAVAVAIAGLVQFLWLLWACERAGVSLKLRLPKLTPEVKRLGIIILPATVGAGIYQMSQFIDGFFASRLAEGSLSYLNYADRLNQLPLGVIGIALGTAILPSLARHIASDNKAAANVVQNRAVEMGMFLTVPAAAALAVLAGPLVQAFYLGGKFDMEDAYWTSLTLACLVAGLPAYVLIKVLTPGFFARSDTKTPVKIAAFALAVNVVLNIILMGPMKIAGLALATAISAWINCLLLYYTLHTRGHFTFDDRVKQRLWRIALASAIMAAAVFGVREVLQTWFSAGVFGRVGGVLILVGVGGAVYFGSAILLGAFVWSEFKQQLRRQKGQAPAQSVEV